MSILNQAISIAAERLSEGGMLSPKEFLHVGSRQAVDQALGRLCKKGALIRAHRGSYAVPVKGRFGVRAPSTEAVVGAIRHNEEVVPTGVAAANALGFTTQVPIQEEFLTSGRTRTLSLGSRKVRLTHGPRWQTMLGSRPAGQAVQALSWLGPDQVSSGLKILGKRFPASEWEALRAVRAELPSWMARAISQVEVHA
jgi:hypothetical protein